MLGPHAFRVAMVALTLVMPALASAQGAGTPIDISQLKVKPGDTVWVSTDASGERKGTLTALSPSELSFETDGQKVTVPFSSIRRLERKDPIRNGLGAGLIAGFGGGFALALATGYFGGGDEATDAAGGMQIALVYGGLGALAGAAIDAAVGQRQTVYRAGQKTISFAPGITRKGASMGVQIRW